MRRFFLISSFLTLFAIGSSAQWKPAGDKIKTDWASQINPANVLPEYPRPIMERSDWKNLNGLWNYAVINKGEHLPAEFEGQILVPFAIESSLSGVGKRINENQELVYQRSFDIPSAWKGKQVLLHFGAVDWKTDVWVNDVKVGSHTGGFTPFSFDITAALSGKGNNQLVVKVWDPTDKGPQPRGKQLPRLAGSLVYLCQPVQRSDIHTIMGSADLPVDNIILENLISFRILERLQRSFKVSFRIVKIIRIQGQPTRIPIQPKAGYIGQSRIVQMVQQPPFIRFIAEQPLVFYRYPDIIVLVTSNHGDEIPDDTAIITGLIESGKGIQYRVVNKDSPIGTNPDIAPAVLVERGYEILA